MAGPGPAGSPRWAAGGTGRVSAPGGGCRAGIGWSGLGCAGWCRPGRVPVPCRCWGLCRSVRVGAGRASVPPRLQDWPPRVRAAPRCGRCGRALSLLVQVYCPLERGPAHRALHVFACAAPGCGPAAHSWKVLRSQYSQAQEKEARAQPVPQKQGSNFAAKDWCEEADDWGVSDAAEPPACASLLALGEAVSSSLSRELDCASQLQQLRLAEAAEGSGSQGTHPAASEEMVMETPGPAPVFQPFYINVVDEEDCSGFLDTDHADELLKEYQQREGLDLEQMMSESFAGEGGNEKYEKSEVKSWDHTFHKFMKRISLCPEQILSPPFALPGLCQCCWTPTAPGLWILLSFSKAHSLLLGVQCKPSLVWVSC
ncbi:programmed cell death protein 2-like isoform X3 [Pipra filicauda]|uniref:Programmed cell death protein 2-like isoform X3 n=1 Tax=Pipra filicauda TaxID=649802 RepID=A0A7R5KRJ2_9PASS|nr:programmed cell death protein 2-like isoform X3 [Pipra filicauda]